jgi:spore maturation protein CgeB
MKALPNREGISFVGSLYESDHDFYGRMSSKGLKPYTEGFLRGLIEAQRKVYGVDLTESALTPEVIEDMYRCLPLEPDRTTVATKQWMFATYVLQRQITKMERRDFLSSLSEDYSVDIFTVLGTKPVGKCRLHEPIDFYEKAPVVYGASGINLNISLRSIVNGIPLRCFEIMGSGGFLLTDYRGDMEQFFSEGKEYASFSSVEELAEKADYYLCHETERRKIAERGFERIKAEHSYESRVREMIKTF